MSFLVGCEWSEWVNQDIEIQAEDMALQTQSLHDMWGP